MDEQFLVLKKIDRILQELQKESKRIVERLKIANNLVSLLEKKSSQEDQSEQENSKELNSRIEYLEKSCLSLEEQHDKVETLINEISDYKCRISSLEQVATLSSDFLKSQPDIKILQTQLDCISDRVLTIEKKLTDFEYMHICTCDTGKYETSDNKQNLVHANGEKSKEDSKDKLHDYSSEMFKKQFSENSWKHYNQNLNISKHTINDQGATKRKSIDMLTRQQLLLAEKLNRPDLFHDILSNSSLVEAEVSNEKQMDMTLKQLQDTIKKVENRISENEMMKSRMENFLKEIEKQIYVANEYIKLLEKFESENCSIQELRQSQTKQPYQ